ncbi:type I-E CRISPR-associated protein Cse2/CasB [Kutzneria sp. NPDC052558]|uniref:type I-E CRISPR-associated protein Cse2/CasB n=1 Tax=Kutzneria sp. NPDC052558 TaxID=3364121 RepID=UPI0037C6CDCC
MEWKSRSDVVELQSDARRTLARLRRSLTGPRHEVEAYEFVFAHNPPRSEQDAWLLLAGLYATHPQPQRNAGPRTLGGSLRILAAKRGDSVTRRFTQLLTVDRAALPHYLRQAVQLLRSDDVAVNYTQLLADLTVLLTENWLSDHAHRVRLEWARDYHRQNTDTTPPSSTSA